MTPWSAIAGIWTVWVISWFAASFWAKKPVKRAGVPREFLYRAVVIAGVVLMTGRFTITADAAWRLWPQATGDAGWAVAGLVLAGCLFAWWARVHLGTLWSSNITRKDNHHIVDSGPYGLVRHPIYTGIIFGLVPTALGLGRPSALAGAVLMILGFAIKARLEERFLREELGTEPYDAYAARVPMLVPFTK